ncbi:phage tail protein, partial [Burkholderia sp. Ac-20379]|nr:phage tail protein [Burkholderia sp. Ac-20379]
GKDTHAHADAKAGSKSESKPATKAEARLAAAEAKRQAAHDRQELAAKKRHERQLEAAAKRGKKDDPDVDLLAALVSRTKPADPGPPAPAKHRGKDGVTKVASADAGGSLAARVKECGQRGFFEDQLCRWRVCDGHWGKDAACPSSANTSHQP